MHVLKKITVTVAFSALATVGLGTTSALASAAPPEPAYDPCPAGYWGAIVGYDDSNSTGKRVYACIKL